MGFLDDHYTKTEVFTHLADAPRTPRSARWRGLVCRRPDATAVRACSHAHRSGTAAHKCAAKMKAEEWAKTLGASA